LTDGRLRVIDAASFLITRENTMHRVIVAGLLLFVSLSLSCRTSPPQATQPTQPTQPAQPIQVSPPANPEESAALDQRQIDQAIESGKKALLASQLPDGSWPGYGKDVKGTAMFPVGPAALATYTLLEAGEEARSDMMKQALAWLAANKAVRTYELSLRCHVWLLANMQTKGRYFSNLQADANLLAKAAKDGTYIYDASPNSGVGGDNSNSSYGLLGVWAAARDLRYEVPDEYWFKIMKHWVESQNRDGGWGYTRNSASTVTMTLAGVTCLQICYDKLFPPSFVKCDNPGEGAPLRRGLDWLDANVPKELAAFAQGPVVKAKEIPSDIVLSGDLYHFLWGLQRAGLLTGRKYFGGVDWYRAGAELLLAKMKPIKDDAGGGWTGGIGGDDVSTAYAILFLGRNYAHVLFNKLEFPSLDENGKTVITNDWNCRPRDLAMLTAWLSDQHESSIHWQTVNFKVPLRQWSDAPILYIAGSKPPSFTDADIATLRAYVLQGGAIFSCTECAGQGFQTGIRDAYKRIFPEYEMVEVSPWHDIFNNKVQNTLQGEHKLFMITNGIRPLVIHTDEDLPKAWELNQTGTHSGDFKVAENIFMYLTDKGKLRKRDDFRWPEPVMLKQPKATIKIVRLKWNGNWNPEPLALERFSRLFKADQQIDLQVVDHLGDKVPSKESERGVTVANVGKTGVKLAILSGVGEIKLTPDDIAALKSFVANGNYLLVEAAGGDKDFCDSMETILGHAYGANAIRTLAPATNVFNLNIPNGQIPKVQFRGAAGLRAGPRTGPVLRAIMIDGKPAIFVSREDISNAGLVGYQCYGVDGYDPGTGVDGSAYRIMRNIVLYATKPGAAGAKK
jgi:hypothetical protein